MSAFIITSVLVLHSFCLTTTSQGHDADQYHHEAIATSSGIKTSRKLMMFLFDAFRWDYADLPGLTGFPRLFKNGVRAEYMRSEYPTNSWPNHFTITTGLHVESHGMVDNSMYDPDLKEVFKPGNENYWKPHWWNGGDPIWITATRQGLRAHMYYWLGADVEIRGLRPQYWRPYPDKKIEGAGATYANFTLDIDEAVELFKNDSVDLVGGVLVRHRASKNVWPYMLSICLAYFVTLCLFPGVESEIISCSLGSWMPVILMGLFNLFDFIGKLISAVPYDWPRWRLVVCCACRVVLVPLLMLCAAPRQHPLLSGDAWSMLFSVLLGVTNGYFGSIPMIIASTKVPDEQKEITGNIMTLSYSVGLTTGSAVAYSLDAWLGPHLVHSPCGVDVTSLVDILSIKNTTLI